MTSMSEMTEALGSALHAARRVVDGVGPTELGRPTPCAGWDVRQLLEHVVGQHLGFAAAVRDGDADLAAFAPRQLAAGAVAADWHASADELVAAFAVAPAARPVRLAEIAPDRPLPLPTVAGFQLLDTVVHTWDLARALGRDHRPDAALAAAVLRLAWQVPAGAARRPGGAFAPVLEPASGRAVSVTDDWAEALALLGRDVAWPTSTGNGTAAGIAAEVGRTVRGR